MQHRREDKTTVFKDDVLCGVALCGAVGQVIDASWMLADGHSYAWGGPLLRLKFSALAGGFQLCDYESWIPGSIPGKGFSGVRARTRRITAAKHG